jgi:Holliday junction resolvasome RuvABC endonuclease subunit
MSTTPARQPPHGPLLCLDVSSSCTGWAAFHAAGPHHERPYSFDRIRPLAKLPSVQRIDRQVAKLREIVRMCEPALVVMEWSSGKTHGRIARASGLAVLGQAQGAVRQLLADLNVPVVTVPENEWTKGSPKRKRAENVRFLVPNYRIEDDPGFDIADAIGLGLYYKAKQRQAELIARATEANATL